MIPHSDLVALLDALLGHESHLDYAGAWNGLQVQGPSEIKKVAVAVDASGAIIRRAAEMGADFLLVHHGLFWDAERRITGHRYHKLERLIRSDIGLYASHLPLDRHPEVGNSVLLLRGLGLEPAAPFGDWNGNPVGWSAPAEITRKEMCARIRAHLPGAPLRPLWFGEEFLRHVAVVTGSAADFMNEAAAAGIGTLVTGEASHQHFAMAQELGMNLVLAGHYATETAGVRAVGDIIASTFGLPVTFLDDPSPF
jgi:dinuclear metal center YbgI/SA1388 family protein